MNENYDMEEVAIIRFEKMRTKEHLIPVYRDDVEKIMPLDEEWPLEEVERVN